jgi:DNA-binding NtrC family response regulator
MPGREGRRSEGNVRELKNVIERGLIFADGGDLMPAHISAEELTPGGGGPGVPDLLAGDKSLEEVEAQVILATLRRHGWNKTQASKVLGITRNTLLDKRETYKLEY